MKKLIKKAKDGKELKSQEQKLQDNIAYLNSFTPEQIQINQLRAQQENTPAIGQDISLQNKLRNKLDFTHYLPSGVLQEVGSAVNFATYPATAAINLTEPQEYFKKANKAEAAADMLMDISAIVGLGKGIKNSIAFKPTEGSMYRGIGEEGMKDALKSKVFRAKPSNTEIPTSGINLKKSFDKTYWTPEFNLAKDYSPDFIAEVPRDVANFRNRYPNKDWSQIADIEIPIEKGKILKKDWLRGYKEIKENGGMIKNRKNKKAEMGQNINFDNAENPYQNAYKPIPQAVPTAPQQPVFQAPTTNNYSTPADRPIDNNVATPSTQPIVTTTPRQNRSTSFGIKGNFNTADMTAGIIAGVNSLLPDQRKKDNINRLQEGYNPYPNGDNSQAIFKEGGNIKKNDPIYVDSPNDPRYKAYQDSLLVYPLQIASKEAATKVINAFDDRSKNNSLTQEHYNDITAPLVQKMQDNHLALSNFYRKHSIPTPKASWLHSSFNPDTNNEYYIEPSYPKQPVKVGQHIDPIQLGQNSQNNYQPQYTQVPNLPAFKAPDDWYSNNQNIPIDGTDDQIDSLYNDDGSRKYVNGGHIPYLGLNSQTPVTPEERNQWEKIQSNSYRNGYLGNDHNQSEGNSYLQSQGFNPDRLAMIQQDFQQQDPSRINSSVEGLSPVDNYYGHKTAQQRYKQYEYQHTDRFGNTNTKNYGTDYERAIKENPGNGQWFDTPEWQSNAQGIPMASNSIQEIIPINSPQSIQRNQQANWHTDENTDYSLDSIREAKSGIHIKPENKGKFTAYKKRTGKTTEEALHSKDPHVRQMANFAKNAKHWNHKAEYGTNMLAENGLQVEGDKYKMLSPHTAEILGDTHENGGTNIAFGSTQVEAEKGEPITLDKYGNAVVLGNMYIPTTNTKFKSAGKDIAEQENKISKLQNKATTLLSIKDPSKLNDILSFNSASVMNDAVAQKNKSVFAQKDALIQLQNTMLEAADKMGINPKNISKEFEAKMGMTMKKGKNCFNGGSIEAVRSTSDNIRNMVKAASGYRFDQDAMQTAEPLSNIPYTSIDYAPENYNVTASRINNNNTSNPYLDLKPFAGDNSYLNNAPLQLLNAQPQQTNISSVAIPELPPYKGDMTSSINPINHNKPYSLADKNRLRLSNILPEISLLGQYPDQVVGQQYNPQLLTPYQVSFQDRKNDAQSTFNALNKNLVGNAAATSSLAAQKYNQENSINAEEFRTNQSIQNDVLNKNYSIMNDASKINLQFTADQLDKQARAIAATKGQKYQALASISNKYDQKRAENNNIHLIESMSNYRFNPASGKVEYIGDPYQFVPNSGLGGHNTNNKEVYIRDKDGNIIKQIETDYPDAVDETTKAKARKTSMKRWGGIF